MCENPGAPVIMWWASAILVEIGLTDLALLVEIGLTDLPESGGAMALPAPPGTTPLSWQPRNLRVSYCGTKVIYYLSKFKF